MRPLVIATIALVVAVPLVAVEAADGSRAATPALFLAPPCITVVDRAADPVFHIEYAVAQDDLAVTPEEVADGRRHQFFALRRQFTKPPPNWITWDDVMRAQDAPATDPVDVQDDEVLETSSQWPADQWIRITPDDMRLEISMTQAAMGVDWDTTDVPQGTYLLAAYTWDPAANLWSPRWGGVKVVDDASDPSASPPAAFLEQDGATVVAGDTYDAPACVDAMAGSTVTAYWAEVVGVAELDWQPFLIDDPVQTGPISLAFDVPADLGSTQVELRVDVIDPMGRNYTAYTPGVISVAAAPDGETDTDTSGSDSGGGGGGGGCGIGSTPSGLGAAFLGLMGLFGRKRTRAGASANTA